MALILDSRITTAITSSSSNPGTTSSGLLATQTPPTQTDPTLFKSLSIQQQAKPLSLPLRISNTQTPANQAQTINSPSATTSSASHALTPSPMPMAITQPLATAWISRALSSSMTPLQALIPPKSAHSLLSSPMTTLSTLMPPLLSPLSSLLLSHLAPMAHSPSPIQSLSPHKTHTPVSTH